MSIVPEEVVQLPTNLFAVAGVGVAGVVCVVGVQDGCERASKGD